MAINIDKIEQAAKADEKKRPSPVMELLNRDIKLFGSSFGDKKKEKFYSELQTLLNAGVDIKTVLEIIEQSQAKEDDQALIQSIRESIVKGNLLNEALRESGKFTDYEVNSIKIGEESGKLSEVLYSLQTYFERQIEQKRLVINAISYPAIVLFTSFGAVFFLMRFVVPMFKDLFKRFNTDLPTVTQWVLGVSEFLTNYFWLILLVVAASAITLISQRKQEWYMRLTSSILLRVPFFGELVRKIHLAKFCQSLGLLISAKTPVVRSLTLTKGMVDFYPIASAIDEIEREVTMGVPLNQCLAKYPVFDKKMLALLKVGEEANQLDKMFDKLYKQYSDEARHQLNLIGTIVEPVMIVFLGGIVAIILVAMYLPLFKLSSGIYPQ